jgi:hypothetical protein
MYGLSSRESLSRKQTRWVTTDQPKILTPLKEEIKTVNDDKKILDAIKNLELKITKDLESVSNKITDLTKFVTKSSLKNNEFIPFYNREDFTCCDNKTTIKNGVVNMTVELLGHIGNIIYPFGNNNINNTYPDQKITMHYMDNEMLKKDIIHGNFKKDKDVYIIELTDVFMDTEKISLKDLVFPVVITYEGNL